MEALRLPSDGKCGKRQEPEGLSCDTGSRHCGDSFLGLLTGVLTGKVSMPSAGCCCIASRYPG
jgi:hypothetical protein